MEPKAFLDLAQKLSKEEKDEASLRSSVSRAYYALFNSMAKFVRENVEKLSRTAKDHDTIYKYFHNCGMSNLAEIATSLSDLRNERNDSDYDLELDKFKNPNNVVLLFAKAKIAFNSFEKITNNQNNRAQIISGIREYKNSISPH